MGTDVTGHVASQQLPDPTTPWHSVALALVEQWVTIPGHVALDVQIVVPSSQSPFVHVPGSHREHVTNPDFFPHVDRAAHRVTAPLQFAGS
jgi:hypothetical protein